MFVGVFVIQKQLVAVEILDLSFNYIDEVQHLVVSCGDGVKMILLYHLLNCKRKTN